MGQELEAILTEDVQDHCGLIAGTEETGDAWRREKLSRRPVEGARMLFSLAFEPATHECTPKDSVQAAVPKE